MVTTDRLTHRLSTAIQTEKSSVSSVAGNPPSRPSSSAGAQTVYRISVDGLLPNGQLKVEVNGQQMQLRLSDGQATGQSVVLTSLSEPPKTITLQPDHLVVSDGKLQTAQQWVSTQRQVYDADLSSSAKLISSLTSQSTKGGQDPVRIVSAEPLLTNESVSKDTTQSISSALQQSIKSSGLFY